MRRASGTLLALAVAALVGCADDGAVGQCDSGSASFSVVDHSFRGKALHLDVRYSGGCADHEFEAWWDGLRYDSLPPMIRIDVHHRDGGDRCEAIVTEEVVIDLSALDGVIDGDTDFAVHGNGRSSGERWRYDYPADGPAPDQGLPLDTACSPWL